MSRRTPRGVVAAACVLAAVAGARAAIAQLPEPYLAPAHVAAARQLIRHALQEAPALKTSQERAWFRMLAQSQAKIGDASGAERTLALVPTDLPDTQNTLFTIIEVARARARGGNMNAALQTVATVPPGYAFDQAMLEIVKAQALRDVPAALATASRESPALRDSMVVAIARTQAERGDVAGALGIISSLANWQRQPGVVQLAVTLHARRKNLAEALRLARSLTSANDRAMCFLGFAAFQAYLGDTKGALQSLAEVPEGKWRDLALFGVAVGRAKAGDFAGARSSAATFADAAMRALVEVAIARVQARKGDFTAALGTAAGISHPEAKDNALHQIALDQARRGDVSAAMATIAGTSPRYDRRQSMISIAEIQAEAGDLAGARATIAGLTDPFERRGAQMRIAVAHAKTGDIAEVLAQVASVSSNPFDRFVGLQRVIATLLQDPNAPTGDPFEIFKFDIVR